MPQKAGSRVDFDENRTSISRRTISNIGQEFQKAALQLYQKENYCQELVVLLRIIWERNKLVLYGKTENVSQVETKIESLISTLREKKIGGDLKITYFPDSAKFEAGFKLKSIKHIDPKEFFTAKGGKSHRPKGQKYEYWNIKNVSRNQLTIFINEGNDTWIFCAILQNILLKDKFTCKITFGNIQMSCQDNYQEPLEKIVRDRIQNNRQMFLPEIVDENMFLVEIVDEHGFLPEIADDNIFLHEIVEDLSSNIAAGNRSLASRRKERLHEIWQRLEVQWVSSNPFWNKFCRDLEGENVSNANAKVKYVPSRCRFEIYASEKKVRFKIKDSLTKKMLEMCEPKNCWTHNIEHVKYTKSSLWKVAATLGEIRHVYSSISFTLLLTKKVFTESDVDRTEEGEVTKLEDEKDLDVLYLLDEQSHMIQSIAIKIQCPNSNIQEMKAAQALLEKLLPSKVVVDIEPSNSEHEAQSNKKKKPNEPKCCMCKRKLIFKTKNKNNKDSDSCKKIDEDIPVGHKLTLCGCSFCRECFFNSVTMKLKSHTEVQCERCDSVILTRDCQNIINPFFWKRQTKTTLEDEIYNSDWKYVMTLSYQNYCSSYTELVSGIASVTCKGCKTVMLYRKKSKFVYCRNMRCGCLICTTCGSEKECTHNNHHIIY